MYLKNGWRNSLNRKGTLMEETLEYKEERKNTETKNTGKYKLNP